MAEFQSAKFGYSRMHQDQGKSVIPSSRCIQLSFLPMRGFAKSGNQAGPSGEFA